MSSVWSSVSSSKPFSKFFQHQSPQSLQVACAGQVGASANQLPGPAFRLDRPIGARSATVRFRCFVDLPQGGPLPRPSGPTGGSQRVWVILTSHDGLHAFPASNLTQETTGLHTWPRHGVQTSGPASKALVASTSADQREAQRKQQTWKMDSMAFGRSFEMSHVPDVQVSTSKNQ